MDNNEMNKRILDCTNEFLYAASIFLRGFVTCNNDSFKDKRPILLTGINPSFPVCESAHPGVVDPFIFADAVKKDQTNRHWGKKRRQFGDLYKEMAYLDLFPIRETEQQVFEKAFRSMLELRSQLLSITQESIEDLAPRLIVHANRASLYYWGFVSDNPWMGYEFEPVTTDKYGDLPECMSKYDRATRFRFYRITGFSKNPLRINQDRYPKRTALEGSFFMEYIMEYRDREDIKTLYEPEEWKKIWSWVKDHTNSPDM